MSVPVFIEIEQTEQVRITSSTKYYAKQTRQTLGRVW